MKKWYSLLLVLFLAIPMFAQESHEVKSEVAALTEFHDVIYQIWHTAWPQKDIALLKSFTPAVVTGYEKIAKAELPGILREKKAKWEEGLKKFSASVDDYKKASAGSDDKAMMDAAEKLHMLYEGLVRTIKPVLKEMDAFHQELYSVYHYYLPKYEFEKIKKSAVVLQEKMDLLMNAKLSEKQKSKQEAFDKARNELAAAVKNLNAVIAKGDVKEAVNKAVDAMHSKYEELEKIFG